MKKKKIMAILTVMAITSSLLVGSFSKASANDVNSSVEAEKIVSEMSLEEKIGQMLMVDFRQWKQENESSVQDFTEMNNEVANIIDEFDLGGVILFAQNVKTTEQTAKLTHELQQVAINDEDGNLPLLTTIDQEGGIVTRLGTGTNFPGNMAIGATKNEQSSYDTGSVIGKELNSLGINVNFAPSVDVNNNPSNPVIGLRSFSSNPDLVSKLGVQMIKGIQDEGVSAAAKHFPGHGDTATDSHAGLPRVDKPLSELKNVELKPFQAAIDNGVDMIMTAHIQFPQIEKDKYISKKDGQEIEIPATLSDDVLTGLLRENMNFDGVIITDALNMAAISENFGEVEAVKMAFDAGVDIALMPTILRSNEDVAKLRAIVDGVKEAVESGELSEETINDSARRVVKLKIDRGVINVKNDNRTEAEKVAYAKSVVGSKENRDVERRVSAEAITVVKNENNILPLNPKKDEKVLLVAPYDNELPGMKFGVNRLIQEGKVNPVNLDTYCYKSQSEMTEELKSKIDEADYVVVLSEMGNYTHLAKTHWITAMPNAIVDYANELNKDSVVVSVGKPYDVAAHTNSKAEVIAYGYKGMDPTEADGGLSPVQAFGPNIPASIEVIFGGAEAKGTLPVDIPVVDDNGVIDMKNNAYDYGFGITNLTSVGVSNIEMPKEVKSYEEFEVKVSVDDIAGLKSEDYLVSLGFNSSDFELVSVKSNDSNLKVKNTEVNNSIIDINLEDASEEAKTSLILTFKAIATEANDAEVINSINIVDDKERTFNTSLEGKTINVVKDQANVENPDENNKPNEDNGSNEDNGTNQNKPSTGDKDKEPQTGDASSLGALGLLTSSFAALGFTFKRKKK